MNFSPSEVEKRINRLQSPASHRLNKTKLITIRILLIGFLFLLCFGCSMLLGAFQSTIAAAPDLDSIQIAPSGYTTTLLDTDGKTIQTLVGKDANRQYVTLDQIPVNLQNAFIAIEDERFYSHHGVDFQGILRAFALGLANGGHFSQGASTLTQQLLKNQVFEGGEEKTILGRFQRKIQEQYLAIQLEKHYSKQQILEYYLNTINLGQNTLGVQAASKRYFNKSVSELSLSECAVLAGITQNPSAYNPITHASANSKKRTTVLTYMKEQGYITSNDYNTAINDDVYSRIQTVNQKTRSVSTTTSYFTDALIQQVIKDLKQKLGYTETQAYNALYSRGLKIQTTQDSSMQKICDSVINNKKYYPAGSSYQLTYQLTIQKADGSQKNYDINSLKQFAKKHYKKKITSYFKKKSTGKKYIKAFKKSIVTKQDHILAENVEFVLQPQVSFVLIDQHTGNVKAICGGRGTKAGSRTFNRATDSTRQPGSTFKVLAAYVPALDTAGMTLATVQDDAKYYYPGTKKLVKNWYSTGYRGLSSIRQGIKYSMNVVAVKTLEEVTPKIGYDYLQNLSFTTLVDNYTDSSGNTYTDIALPLALGGLTKGVTNLELTNGFASIANGGTHYKTSFYTKIYDHDGNLLLENDNEGQQVMKESTAWLLTNAMEDVIKSGTATKARFKKISLAQAGKSGTTTHNKDLWFVGYTPYLTGGVWSGYDDSSAQSSGSYTKEIWRTIMERLSKKSKHKTFTKPSSITTASICTKCGKLAIEGICNNAVGGSCIRKEYFDRENVPTENCDCHIKCQICSASGALANDRCPSYQVHTKIYLQKKETSRTNDTPYVLPDALSHGTCHIH
jgi:penicillin-binding protein 1A